MRLLDFLTERDTHWYGWIDHTGQFEPGYHGKVVALNFGDDIQAEHGPLDLIKQVGEEHYRYAFEHGWIRVYQIGQELGFQFYKTASKVAIQKMIWIIDHFDDPRNIVLEFADKVGQDTRIEWAKSSQEAKRIINQWIRGTLREGVQIPDTDYGYWITHHGEFLEVPYEGHAHVAQRYFRRHPEEWEVPGKLRPTGYERAFELGWIRIIERGGVGFGVRDPHLCRAETLRAVFSYIRQIHPDHKLFLDLGYTAPRPNFKDDYHPTKQELSKYFMHYLMGKRRPQMVAEAEIPETDYGYWITHEGQMLPVSRQAHEPVAERYLRAHPELGTTRDDAMTHVLDLGWIRIIDVWQYNVDRPDQKQNTIGISVMDPRKLSSAALNMLLGYLRQTDAAKYYLDAFSRDIPNKRHGKAEVVNYFKQLFFKAKRQVTEAHEWSRYGYWIDKNGRVIPVAHEEHEHVARHQFAIDMKRFADGTGTAKRKGWIRVVDNGREFDLELYPEHTTKAALKSALALLGKIDHDNCFIEDNQKSTYLTRRELVEVLRKLIQGNLTEGEIPSSSYGYWITAEGKYIPVRYQGHQDEANRYFPRDPGMELSQWGNAAAFKQGWIKVERSHDLHVDFFPRYVTKPALYALLKLGRQVDPGRIYLDLLGATKIHDPFQQVSIARFNQIIRTVLQMKRVTA